jgi:hypothetical protein
MILVALIGAAAAILVVGIAAGYHWGHEDGAEDTYEAVTRWHEGRRPPRSAPRSARGYRSDTIAPTESARDWQKRHDT